MYFMNRFIKMIRLTIKITRTCRKGTTTINKIINRFTDIIQCYDVSDVVLVFLLLTEHISHLFLECLFCWLWKSKCQLGWEALLTHFMPLDYEKLIDWHFLTNSYILAKNGLDPRILPAWAFSNKHLFFWNCQN